MNINLKVFVSFLDFEVIPTQAKSTEYFSLIFLI